MTWTMYFAEVYYDQYRVLLMYLDYPLPNQPGPAILSLEETKGWIKMS